MTQDSQKRSDRSEPQSALSRRELTKSIGAGAFAALVGGLPSMAGATPASEANPESDPWRPEYHFTPSEGWMNDPNGLVYQDGVYHLFYQAGEWPRRWDHATSTDLINWTEHGTKIPATDTISPFSGGAVVDHNNTAGFGEDALVCMYTGHHIDTAIEDQRIAYSTDNGETVTKYEENPVIPSDVGDFRDPKPFWYEPAESWRMAVGRVSAAEGRPAGVEIYSSDDLVDWTYESTYEADGESWECPSLFELPVAGSDETKWVVAVSPIEIRSVEYHIGHFDGTEFVAEDVVRADYGYDFYAFQSWSNTPEERGLNIVWMNNWNYAMDTPDPGWQGAMTVPRTITLEDVGDGVQVRQHPADELSQTRQATLTELDSETVSPGRDPLGREDLSGRTLELVTTIDPHSADQVGLRVREGEDEESVITYDAVNEELRFDRTNAGEFFEEGYYGESAAPLEPLDGGTIELQVFVDRCSVEIFANDGRRTMSHLVFPDWESTGVSLFAERGAAKVEELRAYDLAVE